MTATAQQRTTKPAADAEPDDGGSLLNQAIQATTDRLERLSGRCLTELDAAPSALRRALLTARAVEELDRAVSPDLMKLILKLQNSPLGFLTDKPEGGYPEPVVRRVIVEALLNGCQWTGNEFNIISGRLYITQSGYARKVRELPGLSDLEIIPGVPQVSGDKVVVRMGARWKFNGQPFQLRDAKGDPGIVYPVTARGGATADNLIGKGKRKALKTVYERVTGTEQTEDFEETPLVNAALRAADGKTATQRLEEKLTTKPATEPAAPLAEGELATAGADMFPASGPYQDKN